MFVRMCAFLRAIGICNFVVNSIKFNLQFWCTQPDKHTHARTPKQCMLVREFANNHDEGNGSAHVGVTIAALAMRAPNVYWVKQERSRKDAKRCSQNVAVALTLAAPTAARCGRRALVMSTKMSKRANTAAIQIHR